MDSTAEGVSSVGAVKGKDIGTREPKSNSERGHHQSAALASNLRTLRKNRQMSISQLSALSGVAIAEIASIEAEKTPMDLLLLGLVERLSKALNVPLAKLLQFERESPSKG